MTVRRLEVADLESYHRLRLRALEEEPTAFLSSPEDEKARGLDWFRGPKAKNRHKAMVWGVYVAPEARRRGLSRGIMEAQIAHARETMALRVAGRFHDDEHLYLRL